MASSLRNSPAIHPTLFFSASSQLGLQKPASFPCSRRGVSFFFSAEQASAASTAVPYRQDRLERRQVLAVGAIATWVSLFNPAYKSFAAEAKKGFLAVSDQKDGYSFLYPFGWQIAEFLIKKVLAPPSQKTKLVEAVEHDVDGKAYYTFEFIAQAPNYTRHALGAISIGNGKLYTSTTGAKERRWEKMKDRLHRVIDSFKISNA
ncbi:hypothetical protein HHK36_016466 [Tetracentron sinense]|uniref:PsbP C-terminal domain-containing protein n=1 Tax=Tetracentron sinense TaxID=13715 RepID=A0A835DB07_TETSI|nr:hypothetical protein HHK36_016466 [Tetracentron sinense]